MTVSQILFVSCNTLNLLLYRLKCVMHNSTGACPRTVFTEEQKQILMQAYENGVNTINKNQAQSIKSLADQLQCDEAVVKVIFLIVYPFVSIN